jgi:hypothetical protein
MNDIKDIQHDDILRQAVMRNQQKQPKMPADLNEKLLARLTAEPAVAEAPAAPEHEAAKTADRKPRRAVMMRWISAAACALVLIGIGITVINTDDKAAKIEARAEIAPQPAIDTTADSSSQTANDAAASASTDQPKVLEPAAKASAPAAKARTTRTARKASRPAEQTTAPESETAKRKIEVKVISRAMGYEELLMATAQAQPEAIRARGQRLYNDVAQTTNFN